MMVEIGTVHTVMTLEVRKSRLVTDLSQRCEYKQDNVCFVLPSG